MTTRLDVFGEVATALALLSNVQLRTRVDSVPVVRCGIGGTGTRIEVAGRPVYVKRVPLTELERRPENVLSTANVFALPGACHYGLRSPGFGAWRELAAHVMTANQVIAGRSESFPLLYHWRVLDGAIPLSEELADPTLAAGFKADTAAVNGRLESIQRSVASIALFLEYVPHNLHEWLTRQPSIEAVCETIENQLVSAVADMNGSGLWHFDAHFGNILTDGRQLYFTDFGLALSHRFNLAADERAFLHRNRTHDACHTMAQLVNWLVVNRYGRADRDGILERCRSGDVPADLGPAVARIILRHVDKVVVFNEFYRQLYVDDPFTPFPL